MESMGHQALLREKFVLPWISQRPVARLHGHTLRDQAITRCSQNPEFDVSRTVVQPSFRSAPVQQDVALEENQKVRILFVGESNICRSVLAESCCRQLIIESGLSDYVECESKGTRDYNIGDGADPSVVSAALDMMVLLPKNFQARKFKETVDIVHYDMLLVMDKFTAADVLREVSVFDTIQKGQGYSQKVRRLGEFHPQLKKSVEVDGQDIEDPLYGNVGGVEEKEAVKKIAVVVESACLGLIEYLQAIRVESGGGVKEFKAALQESIRSMEGIDWLVPPMLQPSVQK